MDPANQEEAVYESSYRDTRRDREGEIERGSFKQWQRWT
jgi:hypothetical protein